MNSIKIVKKSNKYKYMILSGIDIVSIPRIHNLYRKYSAKFIKRILTDEEVEAMNQMCRVKNILLNLREEAIHSSFFCYIAKRFAAKEAYSKAIGVGIGLIKFNEIEILNDNLGRPYLSKNTKDIDLFDSSLSITDEYPFAIANVILIKK